MLDIGEGHPTPNNLTWASLVFILNFYVLGKVNSMVYICHKKTERPKLDNGSSNCNLPASLKLL